MNQLKKKLPNFVIKVFNIASKLDLNIEMSLHAWT